MKPKDYVQQYSNIDLIINSKNKQLENLKNYKKKVDYLFQTNNFKNAEFEEIINETMKYITNRYELLNNDVTYYNNLKNDIIDLIDLMNNNQLKLILKERYINKKTWYEISENSSYCLKHIHRLHNAALKELNNIESKKTY